MLGLRFPQITPEHTDSWYAATANGTGNYPALDGDIDADVAVLGGGFSGVNTALETVRARLQGGVTGSPTRGLGRQWSQRWPDHWRSWPQHSSLSQADWRRGYPGPVRNGYRVCLHHPPAGNPLRHRLRPALGILRRGAAAAPPALVRGDPTGRRGKRLPPRAQVARCQ